MSPLFAILWIANVIGAVSYVAWDIRKVPSPTVMKWAFVIFTAFSGAAGALLYFWACRELLYAQHENYVAARWRQVVGSTMHCVAGDGLGILVTAAVVAPLGLPKAVDLTIEYVVGFTLGWTIFQALFMRNMAGTYRRSLRKTFLPEFLSMNFLMAAMMVTSSTLMSAAPIAADPTHPAFWFVMSIALSVGFVVAYPINWWLVSRGLKHGMLTVRPYMPSAEVPEPSHEGAHDAPPTWPRLQTLVVTTTSLMVLASGATVALVA